MPGERKLVTKRGCFTWQESRGGSPTPSPTGAHGEKLAGVEARDPGRQVSSLTSGYVSERLPSPQCPENCHSPSVLLSNLSRWSLSSISLGIRVPSCSLLKSHCKCQGVQTWSELSLFFGLFRAAPEAYGASQDRGPVGAVAASLSCSHNKAISNIAVPATYTTAHSHSGSLTQ